MDARVDNIDGQVVPSSDGTERPAFPAAALQRHAAFVSLVDSLLICQQLVAQFASRNCRYVGVNGTWSILCASVSFAALLPSLCTWLGVLRIV